MCCAISRSKKEPAKQSSKGAVASGGTVWGIIGFAVVLLAATVVLSMGGQILGKVQTAQQETTAFSNESLSFAANNTNINLANRPNVASLTLYYFGNQTNAIGTSYYAFTASQIKLYTNSTVAGYPNITNNTVYYAWGNYNTNPAPYNITQKGIDSLTTFGDWLPTLALVVIAAIIIGIIVTYLVVRLFGNQGSGI